VGQGTPVDVGADRLAEARPLRALHKDLGEGVPRLPRHAEPARVERRPHVLRGAPRQGDLEVVDRESAVAG
jgi:hypothetical protein